MAYVDYSKIKHFQKLSIGASVIAKIEALRAKHSKAKNDLEALENKIGGLFEELDALALEQAKKEMLATKGLVIGNAYVATPKFPGRVLNVILSAVDTNYDKRPRLLCAVVGGGGKITKTEALYPDVWEFVPAANIIKKK
jgi:hypothetical protein